MESLVKSVPEIWQSLSLWFQRSESLMDVFCCCRDQEQDNWYQREQELLHKIDQVKEANLKVMQMERVSGGLNHGLTPSSLSHQPLTLTQYQHHLVYVMNRDNAGLRGVREGQWGKVHSYSQRPFKSGFV